MNSKFLKWGIIAVTILILASIYRNYNPIDSNYFPKCIFKSTTGLKCPGCGSQRAIHHLLNFDIYSALHENIIFVLSIPYTLLGFIFDSIKNPNEKMLKWRKILFGKRAIFTILLIIISFFFIRNII